MKKNECRVGVTDTADADVSLALGSSESNVNQHTTAHPDITAELQQHKQVFQLLCNKVQGFTHIGMKVSF